MDDDAVDGLAAPPAPLPRPRRRREHLDVVSAVPQVDGEVVDLEKLPTAALISNQKILPHD